MQVVFLPHSSRPATRISAAAASGAGHSFLFFLNLPRRIFHTSPSKAYTFCLFLRVYGYNITFSEGRFSAFAAGNKLNFKFSIVSARDLTQEQICAKFEWLKAVTKTRNFRRIPREDATLVQGSRNTAKADTTSEPLGRNARSGAPVKASMRDGYALTRVEPWNTLYPTPDFRQGMGLFLCPPRY